MQDDSQAAAKWRRDMKRSIFRIANTMETSNGIPMVFYIEEHPHIGPFLSEAEAEEWIELHERVPMSLRHIAKREAPGSLCDVLRFVIAYTDGALGDSPGQSTISAWAARERLRKAERALKQVEEVLVKEVI